MRERKLYQCEICGTEYKDKATCENCEKTHKICAKIADFRYLSFEANRKGYPHSVEVEFEDGSRAWYKRG